MWLLSFVPDAMLLYVVDIILVVGAVGTIASLLFKALIRWMPWIIPYRTLIQLISMILLVGGVYFKGGYSVEMEWREKVNAAEEKVRLAEEQAREANTKLDEERKKKSRVITDTKIVIQERIVEKTKVIDAQCKVDPEVITILNLAAKRPEVKK